MLRQRRGALVGRLRPAPLGMLAVFVLVLVTAGCRSGPPAGGASEGLAGRRQAVSNKYSGIIVLDAQCSDFANKDDQIVCVKNTGQETVKIGKWLIRNTIGRTYHFPEGTVLEPGKTIRVHTGAGTNGASDTYWNYEFRPVFESKDRIILVDDSNIDVGSVIAP